MRSWLTRFILLGAPLFALVLLAACGTDETKDNVDLANSGPGVTVTVPSFTPISSATPAGTRAATSTATPAVAATGAAGSGSGTGRSETIVATDNKYDRTSLSIPAAQSVTFTLRNQGSAIHSWHVLGAKDASGNDITTRLIEGGQSDTITFTIAQRGSFDFQCDVHPTEMKGTISVQ